MPSSSNGGDPGSKPPWSSFLAKEALLSKEATVPATEAALASVATTLLTPALIAVEVSRLTWLTTKT